MATRRSDALLKEILELPAEERQWLAREVMASLDDEKPNPDAEKAWAVEIERRAREVINGEVELEEGMEFLDELRAELKSSSRAQDKKASGGATRAPRGRKAVRGAGRGRR